MLVSGSNKVGHECIAVNASRVYLVFKSRKLNSSGTLSSQSLTIGRKRYTSSQTIIRSIANYVTTHRCPVTILHAVKIQQSTCPPKN